MKTPLPIRLAITSLFVVAVSAMTPQSADAHCQVPCGIFSDQNRFESMMEDYTTIAKANGELKKLTEELSGGVTPLAINQATRWVTTKEEHCHRIQDTIAS